MIFKPLLFLFENICSHFIITQKLLNCNIFLHIYFQKHTPHPLKNKEKPLLNATAVP